MKSQVCTLIAIQYGSLTYRLTGIREFQTDIEAVQRTTKTSVWRYESSQRRGGSVVTGRLDVEGSPGVALKLLVGNLLALKGSVDVGSGNVAYRYRPARNQSVEIQSLRFLVKLEGGPWQEYVGVVTTAIRVSIRANSIVNMSFDWTAEKVVESLIDPVWAAIEQETISHLLASASVVTINGSPVNDAAEISFEIKRQRSGTRMTRLGTFSRFTDAGPLTISGSINQYFQTTVNLSALVRSASEFALAGVLNSLDGVAFEFDFPRVLPQSGQPATLGQGDVIAQIPFKVLQDDSLDPNSEPTVSLVLFEAVFLLTEEGGVLLTEDGDEILA